MTKSVVSALRLPELVHTLVLLPSGAVTALDLSCLTCEMEKIIVPAHRIVRRIRRSKNVSL